MIKLSTGTTDGLQKITPEQKIPLASEWTVITQEYAVITEQTAIAGITESAELRAYKTAYSALDDFLHNADTGILADFTALSFVESSVYQKKWNDYYTARAKLRLSMAVPPTNQVTDIALAAIPKADKTIDITVTFRYTQGLFKATQFLLYRATDIHAPEAINTDKADTHIIAVLPDAPDNHEYSISLNLPQVSGSAQLHYRFAVTAAFLGAGFLALHSGGIIDGGESWRDVTVEQPETGSLYNYWNYATGELRAGKKDNYIRLNPETNELEHKGITIKVPQVEQRIAEFESLIQEKIDEVNNAARDRFVRESGQLGEVRYFTSKNYTYGFLYANGYAFMPALYPEYYEFWLANFGNPKQKNYLGYDRFGYPKLPDLRGTALRAVDDGAGRCGADMALEYQADAIRNITGVLSGSNAAGTLGIQNGLFTNINSFLNRAVSGDSSYASNSVLFNASRVVPTADDNRVKSYAVYPFIKVI